MSIYRSQQLRNILKEQVSKNRARISHLLSTKSSGTVGEIKVSQIMRGMRGMRVIFTETSSVDPQSGIKFRGIPLDSCLESLPNPLPESMYWLLLTGSVPSQVETEELCKEIMSRTFLPSESYVLLQSLPESLHPMTKLSMGVLSLSPQSSFQEDWESALEDALDLVAKIPIIAACIFSPSSKISASGSDLAQNFASMMGWTDPTFHQLLRLHLAVHSDHDGGNVSAHTHKLVGSTLANVYKAFSAGLNGLAGPLHGRANQEVLEFLLRMSDTIGKKPSDDDIRKYIHEFIKSGRVVPGYGHATLKVVDPRFTAQMKFAQEFTPDSWACSLVRQCAQIIPEILMSYRKLSCPYPNVDAHSGALLYTFGMPSHFFTCIFGVSRAIGCSAQYVWDRALQLPIQRPASRTLHELMG